MVIGQRVTVTDELNVRNDYAYDILGLINENILLYRDRGREQVVTIYDNNMRFKREKKLTFEKKRVRIINITPQDSTINVIYQYRENDTTYLNMRKFDHNVIAQDTAVLEKSVESNLPRLFRFVNSEDRSKTAIFGLDNNDILHIKIINHNLSRVDWYSTVELGEIDFDDEFRKITLGNNGLILLLFEKDNVRYNKDGHLLTFIAMYEGEIVRKSIINAKEKLFPDVQLDYNNQNGNVVITGLSHERKLSASTDYFFINKNINEFREFENPNFLSFGMEFIAELYGKKVGKEKELKDFYLKDVILRQDGGFILIIEMDKDYSRRSAFANPTSLQRDRNFFGPGRGWTDHYNEDVAVIAVKGNGKEHWRTILYKKQFSQDDGGVYSSFFIFKTPSRLKLIYNDEIKNNNTASEYILNPLGKYERNSLLSTDYQNLKLRFKDAVQVSNNTLLVPSEKGYNLRLVKIVYNI
jgi:hypothetical protein